MNFRSLIPGTLTLVALGVWGCANAPGKPTAGETPIVPSEILDFNTLYAQNCSGCHGAEGKGGAALALADPVYLAIADDAVVRRVATKGIPGTSMPAFAVSAGGMLTEKQIDAIVGGIRKLWSSPDALRGASPPSYAASASGNAARGAEVYAIYCSSCHGPNGGGQKASSIVDESFLALLSDQELRTIVIVGRPELGAPDWRSNVPGKPMSAEDVSDVVEWLASQRPKYPGSPYPKVAKTTGDVR
jgi:mono/diheme cytochrome c family protein